MDDSIKNSTSRNSDAKEGKTVFRDSDNTRIRENTNPDTISKLNNSDATQFKQSSQHANPDATRVSPAKRQADSFIANTDTSSVAAHQILKDRFLLEKVLGVGGMGIVYKAKDRLKVEAQDRDPYVAIKVLSEEFKSHPEAFISLQRESRKSQRIAHPNTVKVYDFDRDGDTVFMTMEYMDGKPLDQLIRQYKATGLPRDDGWEIIDGMCSALIHAHAENIVHSDFKPGNVFITGNSMAKIFDFGIARAVANVDGLETKTGDKTVFDAGNLGALTPAYASLEMLEGKTPDVRDDIYALGCVIYEILTGEHPYNKVPADEAFKRGLKLKKITDINKHQWKAIEKSLAFKRENRVTTVEQFYKDLSYTYKPGFKSIAALFILLSVSVSAFVQISNNQDPLYSENDIRNELEYKIRLDLFQSEITKLINNPTFSIDWEENIWTEFSGVSKLLANTDDEWLIQTKHKIYRLYIEKIEEFIINKHFARTKIVMENAYRYSDSKAELESAAKQLALALEKDKKNKEVALNNRRQQEEIRIENKKEEKKNLDSFNLALNNVNHQLQCQARLNMRDFDIAVKKLRSLDRARYLNIEARIINTLAACITHIGKLRPEQAAESKKYATRIFRDNKTIASIVIKPRDACDISIAGLGASGKRTVCRDKMQGLNYGPSLVVIPGDKTIKPFALGKYEVSVKELNEFCSETKSCAVLKTDDNVPATDISIATVKEYLKWLSKKTSQKYRLPSKHEWIYAAKSNRTVRDPNRNCQMSTRGISKGNELVKVSTGKQNPWGIVNYLGNAREWVYGEGRSLIAMGGSYKDAMDKCDITLSSAHTGIADNISGFRVLREVKVR
ncbi:MAG: bifunctional serine/threonine-protein kinase/formylglycine-generating enzyme family protein [Gammaproteobacteria bacterium]|nr:bifunctional serine/threonine-protein kinase/formylglycine-generating enzyme family protein [Gammaproteobacteria bacterium]